MSGGRRDHDVDPAEAVFPPEDSRAPVDERGEPVVTPADREPAPVGPEALREHKNKQRAPLRPLDLRTLALSSMALGFMRPIPGTWGSAPPAAAAFLMLAGGAAPAVYNAVIGAFLIVSCASCLAFGDYAERRFGLKDAPEVVADETAGVCLPLLLLPAAAMERARLPVDSGVDALLAFFVNLIPAGLIAGTAFVLFRACDIVKPWPARSLERLPRGWGVLLDDLMAGLYAAAIVQVSLRLLL